MSSNNFSGLPEHVQQRMRRVAEREATRLARPEKPSTQTLQHADRRKSAVSSTPFGFTTFKGSRYNNLGDDWCGPFSVARRMIAEREEARRKREEELEKEDSSNMGSRESHPLDEIVKQVEMEKKRKEHPSLAWKSKVSVESSDRKGKRENLYVKRKKRHEIHKSGFHREEDGKIVRRIPTLFQLCVQFIASNFDYVESLGLMVDSSIRRAICQELVSTGKMNGAAFDTLAEEGIETLEIIDCVAVTQEQMIDALKKLIPAGLRALILKNAGRCFGSHAVDAICNVSAGEHVKLFALSVSGAYLLRDVDASKLIAVSALTLSSIEFRMCPHIGLDFCNAISTYFNSHMTSAHLMELSLEDIPITDKHIVVLGASSDALRNLKSIKLKHVEGVNDTNIDIMLQATCGNLEGIDFSDNMNLTDQVLSSIRKHSSKNLKALVLSGNRNFTNAGLEAFFTFIPGLEAPPSLKTLDLSSCGFETVNEVVINLAIEASVLKQGLNGDLQETTLNQSKSSTGGLIYLNVSDSSITDTNLEKLTSNCKSSLEHLIVNFCPLITDKGLGHLTSTCEYQLERIEIWGNAQVTDYFIDGHGRSCGKFSVEGAWMKDGRSSA